MCSMPVWLCPLSLPSVKLGYEYPDEGISCSFHRLSREISFDHRSTSRRAKVCSISRQARQFSAVTSPCSLALVSQSPAVICRGLKYALCLHTDRKNLLTQKGGQQIRPSLILHKKPHSSPCNKKIFKAVLLLQRS